MQLYLIRRGQSYVRRWGRCEVWNHNTAVTHFEYVEAPGTRTVWRLHCHNRVEHLAGLERQYQ